MSDILDDPTVTQLATITIEVELKEDDDGYALGADISIERHDFDIPGDIAFAAAVTALETAHASMKEHYEEEYGDDVIEVSKVEYSPVTTIMKGESDGHP